jgi:hypothetical protein
MFRPKWWLIVLLIAVPAMMRLIEHPWNAMPIGALALFCGAYLHPRRWAFLIPLSAMLAGDVGLGAIRHDWAQAFHGLLPFTYGCYALSVVLGRGVRRSWNSLDAARSSRGGSQRASGGAHAAWKALPVGVAALAGALLFFVVTNFGVWAIYPTYPKTWAGLQQCFVAAIPFFRNTLTADVVYTILLFSGAELLRDILAARDESELLRTE